MTYYNRRVVGEEGIFCFSTIILAAYVNIILLTNYKNFMKNNRRKFIINPNFQFKFMGYFLAFTLLTLILFYLANNLFIQNLVLLGQQLNLSNDHIFFKFINKQESNLNWIFVGSTILLLLIQIPLGLFLSHKIAGPIFRFTTILKNFDKDNHSPNIECRKGDLFPEIYSSFNEYLKNKKQ